MSHLSNTDEATSKNLDEGMAAYVHQMITYMKVLVHLVIYTHAVSFELMEKATSHKHAHGICQIKNHL
jgi:hypothetical protein